MVAPDLAIAGAYDLPAVPHADARAVVRPMVATLGPDGARSRKRISSISPTQEIAALYAYLRGRARNDVIAVRAD